MLGASLEGEALESLGCGAGASLRRVCAKEVCV